MDLEKENAALDKSAATIKGNGSIKNNEKAKEAVDKAVAISKSIIAAMSSPEMRPLWAQLKILLDEIYAAKADATK